MKQIDLRSDTVTRPGAAMRKAMAEAEVGDDVFGDDPTVKQLEELAAKMLGKQAALFAASGTQTNLLALLSHCARGDEYIVGQNAHTYLYEAGGGAVLGSIQPQPLIGEPDGTLDLNKVAKLVKPDDFHYAKTRLLCLENTTMGKVLPKAYLENAETFVRERGLRLHLDGARIFNAAVKSGTPASDIASHFDSVSVCLSKGLGAPVGSVLVGDKELIDDARRWRKMVGGGMRQSGIIAAAGIYALENHVDRMADDHQNAAKLAEGLANISGIDLDPQSGQTNMLFIGLPDGVENDLTDHLLKQGILVAGGNPMRIVTHLDFHAEDIDRVLSGFQSFFA